MKDATKIEVKNRSVIKRFYGDDGPYYMAKELHFYKRCAAKRGPYGPLVPDLIAVGDDYIEMEKLSTLQEVVRTFRKDPTVMATLKVELIASIQFLRSIGISHRDLHRDNVLIRGRGYPVFIDFELASWASPRLPAYDIWGPRLSLVDVPTIHTEKGVSVYWNADERKVTTLGSLFGKLNIEQ